jgi:HAD superfamily hydrolase (TIGR01509 family)
LGLVTSAPQQLVDPVLSRLGWADLFECKIYGKPGVCGKPDPALYISALSAFSAAPQNVIAVEDSVSGVRSATTAGIRVVAVTNASVRTRLQEAGAILVVNDLGALLRVLQ